MTKRKSESTEEYQLRTRASAKAWYHKNREKMLEYQRNQRKNYPPGKYSEYSRKSKHGMTQVQWEEMLNLQGGKCPICTTPIGQKLGVEYKESRKGLAVVDHNHVTGEIRGILCSNCNTGIGLLGDSAENAARAASYLSK